MHNIIVIFSICRNKIELFYEITADVCSMYIVYRICVYWMDGYGAMQLRLWLLNILNLDVI